MIYKNRELLLAKAKVNQKTIDRVQQNFESQCNSVKRTMSKDRVNYNPLYVFTVYKINNFFKIFRNKNVHREINKNIRKTQLMALREYNVR